MKDLDLIHMDVHESWLNYHAIFSNLGDDFLLWEKWNQSSAWMSACLKTNFNHG